MQKHIMLCWIDRFNGEIATTSRSLISYQEEQFGETHGAAGDSHELSASSEKPDEDNKVTSKRYFKVLCLSSDTGGGHRASAQALQDCFATLYGTFTTNDLHEILITLCSQETSFSS